MTIYIYSMRLDKILQGNFRELEAWINHEVKHYLAEDFGQLFTKLDTIPATDPKYSHALTLRAWLHNKGIGSPANREEAIRLYNQAIQLGNVRAMNALANIYLSLSREVKDDYRQLARRLYKQAIALNDASAMHNLAYDIHMQNSDYKYYYSKNNFRVLLNKLKKISPIDPDYAQALTLHACMLQEGICGEVDKAAAIALYEQAIELGDVVAMLKRSKIYLDISNDPLAAESAAKAATMLHEQAKEIIINKNGLNTIAATELLEKLATINFHMLFHDLINRRSYHKAINLYDRAIALDHTPAIFNRALMARQKKGELLDPLAVVELYKKASHLKDKTAMFELAQCYRFGRGVEHDINEACKLYYLSQHPNSLVELEDIYNKAYGTEYKTECLNAQKRLIPLYLNQKLSEKAEKLYTPQLRPWLIQEAYRLIDDLPKQTELTQALINFIIEQEPVLANSLDIVYMQFKVHLYHGEEKEALALYKLNLFGSNYLSAYEYYRLGNATLIGIDDLSTAEKIQRLEHSCSLFDIAYQQGDKDSYILLIKFLRDIASLRQDEKHVKAYEPVNNEEAFDKVSEDEDSKQRLIDDQLVNDFHNKQQRQVITALQAYIAQKSSRGWISFFSNPHQQTLALAEKVLEAVKNGHAFYRIPSMQEFFKPLRDNSELLQIINPLYFELSESNLDYEEDIAEEACHPQSKLIK